MPNFGLPEIIIIAIVLIVLFGGAKLAGLGKSTGRALREFKDETKGLRDTDDAERDASGAKPEQGERKDDPPRKEDVTRELTRGTSADAEDAQPRNTEEPRRES